VRKLTGENLKAVTAEHSTLRQNVLPYGGSIVVEHLPRHPKVAGLNPATAIGTGKKAAFVMSVIV